MSSDKSKNQQIVSPGKRREFEALFAEFLAAYPKAEEGRRHIAQYENCRMEAKDKYNRARSMVSEGEDATDFVLDHFLPYQDTPANRERGVWIHVAPVFAKSLKAFFEKSGHARPEDWPAIAKGIFGFMEKSIEDPAALAEACAEFDRDVPVRGMQSPYFHQKRQGRFRTRRVRERSFFVASRTGKRGCARGLRRGRCQGRTFENPQEPPPGRRIRTTDAQRRHNSASR